MVIYCIENLVNGKCYIGQTGKFAKRKREHLHGLRHNKHGNTHLQRSWNKHGKENFRFFVLEKCSSIEELDERERIWIEYFGLEDGYNINTESYYRYTERDKIRMKERMVRIFGKRVYQYDLDGNFVNSYETGVKAEKVTGVNKQLISMCSLGKIERGGDYMWSYERKDKIDPYDVVPKNAIKVIQKDKKTNKVIKLWKSISRASRALDIATTNISKCCKEKIHTAGGYNWEYHEN